MLTEFRRFREQQAKDAAQEGATSGGPEQRRRTKAEAIANDIGTVSGKIGFLEFPDFSTEDRAMIIGAMTAMQNTLNEAIPRATDNRRKPV